MDSYLLYFAVTAQQAPGIVIAHPGQDIELLCNITPSGSGSVAWTINHRGPYGLNTIHSDIAPGYTINLGSNNLIVENIMMNDDRNGSKYQCVIVATESSMNITMTEITQRSNTIILYVAGE